MARVRSQCVTEIHSVLSLTFTNSKKDFLVFKTCAYSCCVSGSTAGMGGSITTLYRHMGCGESYVSGCQQIDDWELGFGVLGAFVKLYEK
jgi:hypothetical protein